MSDLYGVALGGTLAILGGTVTQIINGRREQRRWLADNRKEEYRELLTTLTHAATFLMECIENPHVRDDPDAKKRLMQVYGDAVRVINNRLFIDQEIRKARVQELWSSAMIELEKSPDISQLSERFEVIRAKIVKLAVKNL